MSFNGFGTITFEGDTVRHQIKRGEVVTEIGQAVATLTFQSPLKKPITFEKENMFVVLKDDNGIDRFHGWMRDWTESDDGAVTTYTIYADSPQLTYQLSMPIDMYRFAKGTLTRDAVDQLIRNITKNDDVGTNDIPDDALFSASLINTNLKNAIEMMLATLDVPINWYTTYNEETKKITHHFERQWSTHAGKIVGGEGTYKLSGKFSLNRQSVRNYIRVQAKNVPMPRNFLQKVYFRTSSNITAGRSGRQEYRIPLAKKPIGVKVYLMVGEWSDDPVKLSKCRYYLLSTEGLTESDKGAIIRDIDDALQNTAGYWKVGEMSLGTVSSLLTAETVTTLIEDPNLKSSVKSIMVQLYGTDLKCYLSTKQYANDPLTTNGYILCPSIPFLKDKTKALNSELGENIKPEYLLGYAISFNVIKDITKKYKDDDSIEVRGIKASDVYTLETTDMETLAYYGKGKLQTLKDPILEGEIETLLCSGGTVFNTIFPRPGQRMDFSSPLRGSISDVNVRSTVLTIDSRESKLRISSRYESPLGMLPQTLKAIETRAGLKGVMSNSSSAMEAECTDVAEFSDCVIVRASQRKYNCMFKEQPVRRLWLR